MVVQCCACKRIREGSAWIIPVVSLEGEEISHGYCPVCAAKAFAQIRQQRHSCSRLGEAVET